MNDDVSGSAVTDSVSELVASKPDFFKGFSLIIATQLGRADLSAVCKLAWEAGTPVVVRAILLLFSCLVFKLHGAGCQIIRHARLRQARVASPCCLRKQA